MNSQKIDPTLEGGPMDFSTFIDGSVRDVKGYIRAERKYLRLRIAERFGTLLGKLVHQIALLVAGAFMILFLTIALAFYLGELLSSTPLGFAIVAGAYLVFFLIFHVWWNAGAQDAFILDRINELNDDDEIR